MDSYDPFIAPPTAPTPASASRAERSGFRPFGDDGLSFMDVLDVVNPLQHIPIVSTIYRAVTGDEIGHVPRILGGGIFGGLIGALSSLINVIVEEITGSDIGEHIMGFADDAFNGGSGRSSIAHGPPGEPPYPVDKNAEFWPPRPSQNATAMRSASQRYGDAAALTTPRNGELLDRIY